MNGLDKKLTEFCGKMVKNTRRVKVEPFQLLSDSSILWIDEWMEQSNDLVVGFTTRNNGVSKQPFDSLNLGFHVPDDYEDVLQNRKLLSNKLNLPLENWVMGEQVHGANVVIVDQADSGKGSKTQLDAIKDIDGMLTKQKGILCAALFADCVPIYFFAPATGWIGIAHAGWRGTVNRIAEQMIYTLTENGVDIHDIRVAIGPSISKEAYEVDAHVIEHIPEQYREKVCERKGNGRFQLDLRQLNKEIILNVGVLVENVIVTDYCTYNDHLLFSHRRDDGKTGRMLGFIGHRK